MSADEDARTPVSDGIRPATGRDDRAPLLDLLLPRGDHLRFVRLLDDEDLATT